jgi:hypothetical protein
MAAVCGVMRCWGGRQTARRSDVSTAPAQRLPRLQNPPSTPAMGSYRQFWGCEVPGGAGKEVSVEDGDRLNVCQVRPQRCPMHPCERLHGESERALLHLLSHATMLSGSARQRRGCRLGTLEEVARPGGGWGFFSTSL